MSSLPTITPRSGVVEATGAAIPTPTVGPFATSSSSFPWSTPSNWDHKTRVYLNDAPGYAQLPPCAVTPISTIVRDMSKGCGDGGRLTSYACFCTDSYRKARWDISTDIANSCSKDASAQTARLVEPGLITTAAATAVRAEASGSSSSSDPVVESALDVFEAYCSIGISHGIYGHDDEPSSGESGSIRALLSRLLSN
ncbi:hypothetical protein PG994_004843 [Apiospora phragmitis]|uniref:Extracellular membrane protein CFEM domain-containing protein n=1 Tax=Apiospora phragmitis TaxID=2905665 RepID=A0ABR1VRR2_9PEZI